MKYIRLFLRGFKPLLYGGTKQIELFDMSQIVVLSGENGKGKSSILRELSPYPATRSDYEKNGIKIIEIEHKNDYYVLTSDFSKTSAHSFKKNDEELNVSGTTEVQSDLVNQHFDGFTPLVEKLTSGQCKFSNMSKLERKQVIMATYPSSLLFILEKHKNLMTKIRACNNQLKLMNERKLKLKEAFIADDVLQAHNNQRQLMNEALIALDKDIYMLSQVVQPLKEDPAYTRELIYTKDELLDTCKKYMLEMNCLIASGLYQDSKKTEEALIVHKIFIENKTKEIEDDLVRGRDLREEIEKYHQYLKTDRDEMIRDCERLIETQKEIIKQFTIEDNTPVVDIDEAEVMRNNASDIETNLNFLRSLDLDKYQFCSEEDAKHLELELHTLEANARTKQMELSALEADVKNLMSRKQKYTSNPYKEGCTLACKLRTSVQEIIDSIQVEIDKVIVSGTRINSELKAIESKIDELKRHLEIISPARPIISRFERLTTNKSWGFFICSERTIVEALNTNIPDIYNRYIKIIKKSEAHDKVKKAKEYLATLEVKLATLKADTQPAKQVISETLLKREKQLENITRNVESNKKLLTDSLLWNEKLQKHKDLINKVNVLLEKWELVRRKVEITAIVQFVNEQISYMESVKMQISEKLRELDNIVHEQESLRTRLNEEVEPVIKDLLEQKRKWELIEEQLSPTSGLPHINIVRYINALFIQANAFIKQVWNYEMELAYLKEDEDCDYVFKVLINGDGIVKDINTCSKGQKEIIDLALILAICVYRRYSSVFPLKLDEMTSGLSPEHSGKLFEFLGELFHQSCILQSFIVNHDPVITSSYTDAGYAVLSEDYPLPANCRVITKIN